MRRTALTVLASAVAFAFAPSALAGTTVTVVPANVSESKLAITGDDGPNDVSIDYSEGSDSWDVTIGGGIDSAVGCDIVSPTRLRCPHTRVVDVAGTSGTGNEGMGAGDDSFRIGYGSDDVGAERFDDPLVIVVDLGAGDDFFGGSEADDDALGQEGNDVIDGAEGDDRVSGGELRPMDHPASPSQGSDVVFGGPGSDIVFDGDLTSNRGPDVLDGGSCVQAAHPSCPAGPLAEIPGDDDWVYASWRSGSMTLNLANEGASQGESGEGDTVRKVEHTWTGAGADTVTGNAATNHVITGGGDNTVDVSGDPGSRDVVQCGDGRDTVKFDDDDGPFSALCDVSLPRPPMPTPPFVAGPVPPSRPPPARPPGAVGRTDEALIASVARELAHAGRALRRCGTTGLLRKAGCGDSFTALRPGTVVYRVTAPATGAGSAAGTLIASGRRAIPAAGSYTIKVKATRKGRKRLRKARKLRATLTVKFTDTRGRVARRSKTLVLRRMKP